LARYNNPSGLEQRLYFQQDANFNVTSVTDGFGTVLERYQYDGYGSRTVLTPGWGSRSSTNYNQVIGHQGGKIDIISGLINFDYREFSTSLGRWVSMDPMGTVDGSNLYQFVRSNPVGLVDPLGLAGTGNQGPRPTPGVMHGPNMEALPPQTQNQSSSNLSSRPLWSQIKAALNLALTTKDPLLCEAMNDAAIGTAKSSAYDFAQDVYDAMPPGMERNDVTNAARHLLWQSTLTVRWGSSRAAIVGNTHEVGSPDPNDTKVDLQNNSIGQTIGTNAKKEYGNLANSQLRDLCLDAIKKGDYFVWDPVSKEPVKGRPIDLDKLKR
jgi:RHS repeat-associated protein